jgi:hypothetical protein
MIVPIFINNIDPPYELNSRKDSNSLYLQAPVLQAPSSTLKDGTQKDDYIPYYCSFLHLQQSVIID